MNGYFVIETIEQQNQILNQNLFPWAGIGSADFQFSGVYLFTFSMTLKILK